METSKDDYNRYEILYRLFVYLGWVQILHGEAHFLDLGSRGRNRRLMRRLADVKAAPATCGVHDVGQGQGVER